MRTAAVEGPAQPLQPLEDPNMRRARKIRVQFGCLGRDPGQKLSIALGTLIQAKKKTPLAKDDGSRPQILPAAPDEGLTVEGARGQGRSALRALL